MTAKLSSPIFRTLSCFPTNLKGFLSFFIVNVVVIWFWHHNLVSSHSKFLLCFLDFISSLSQGLLKVWTKYSHWFLLTLKPLEILLQNFQHFYNLERYEFWPNLKGIAQKLDLPRPLEVFYIFGGKFIFWAPMTLIFCKKRNFIEVDNW